MSHTQQRHPANGSTVTPQSPQQPPTSPTTPTSDRHRSTPPPVRHSQRFRVTFATTSSPKTNFFDLNLHQRRQTPFRPLSPLHNVAAHSSTFSPNHPTLPTPPYHNSPNAAESLSKFDIPPRPTPDSILLTKQKKQINRFVFTSPNPDSLGMPTVNLNTFTHNALWNPLAT